ncbi:MAG: DUF2971 domain-containing protein [Hyphomicrobiales bacterium]|nr:DUF2971 domain-containing protein [Hyphomicrobiales bacterium]
MSDVDRLREIFMPHLHKKQKEVRASQSRFVHYTTADAAKKIIETQQAWLRNTKCMNDLSEISHGLQCLRNAYNSEEGERLKSALDNLFCGFRKRIEDLFNGWMETIEWETYVISVSEHEASEDRWGRLSMWRAYGQGAGVALVLNNAAFLSHSEALEVYTYPVTYLNEEQYTKEISVLANNIFKYSSFLQGQGEDSICGYVFAAFQYAAQCIKHPGFKEEKEWRVIYCPKLRESKKVERVIESIKGVPQTIYKIPLNDIPEEGLIGLSIPDLIDRVIIGPTDYSWPIYEGFTHLLSKAGVEHPRRHVVISDIPLR